MEALGLYTTIEAAARAAESIRASGVVPEEQVTSLSSVPLPDGAVTRVKKKHWFHWFALGGGFVGAAVGFLLAAGTAWQYPLYTGDKPIVSAFPVGIITYEFAMMFAIMGLILGMFLEMGLPGFLNRVQAPEVMRDGKIGVSVVCRTREEMGAIKEILKTSGAESVRTMGTKKDAWDT